MLHDLKKGAMYGVAAALAFIAILCGGALWYCLHMPGRTYSGNLPPVRLEEMELAARLKNHVVAVASRPHNVRHYEALEAAAVYIEQSLRTLGYESRPRCTKSMIARSAISK
jgi:hypothetical protein